MIFLSPRLWLVACCQSVWAAAVDKCRTICGVGIGSAESDDDARVMSGRRRTNVSDVSVAPPLIPAPLTKICFRLITSELLPKLTHDTSSS